MIIIIIVIINNNNKTNEQIRYPTKKMLNRIRVEISITYFYYYILTKKKRKNNSAIRTITINYINENIQK